MRPALIAVLAATALAAPPTPLEFFGHEPGADYRLLDFGQIHAYLTRLAGTSDRVRLVDFGHSSEDRPLLAAVISSPENLRQLDRWKTASRRLALGEASPEEAQRLARTGKAVVWISAGLHATEVAGPQAGPRLAWRIATDESPEMRRVRERVIVIYVPVINPDGLDRVAAWYRGNVGTPYETAPLPERYQKYAGHDNNRDYFMLNLAETRHVSRMLFREWFPQIVYDQHQAPAFPARIFVPPYAEPMNPHIPGPVIEGINLIGAAMKERLGREGKTGVLSYLGFDAWWNGGLRTAPAFHNMHGVLTETALNSYATPREYDPDDLPDVFPNGMPAKEPSIFYTKPWKGGRWGVREAIEYMESATLALLDVAAARSEQFLLKSWEMARGNIEAGRRGRPYAYVIDAAQWDRTAAATMVERLAWAGVVVERARARSAPAGASFRKARGFCPPRSRSAPT